ncbi:MAG: hypothetical protein HND52_15080 [Ignavibacteriae bacterium]|nr:hypothetical protein [Ignavibacteriota bacterium]NOG99278.1 hypothetical protein [Ignavibacteriota bacterium]
MYSEYIDRLIINLCKQPKSFEFISLNLGGFDPIELLKTLNELESKGKISNINGLWFVKDPRTQANRIDTVDNTITKFFNEHIGFFGLFKKPHPLDFEWRNSTTSLDYLLKIIQDRNDIEDRILLLGYPTLFAAACIKNIPNHVTLIEKNKPIIDGLSKLIPNKKRYQILETNIFEATPRNMSKYSCVIMDPPWYSPHFYQFLWYASQCLVVGGRIGISLPPINTRPNISKERIDWFSFCHKNGLCLENLRDQKLHYAMPFFEFNAFRAAGVKDVLPFWRKADLAFFRKMHDKITPRPIIKDIYSGWIEKEIESVRFRIKKENKKSIKETIKISHLVKGDILPGVSIRDSRRRDANIWTSGNRIYKVNDTNKFVQLLDKIKNTQPGTHESKIVTEFVTTVCKLEIKEYNNYLDWLYNAMEKQTS